MTQNSLDEQMIRLERNISCASGSEKAQFETQLRALLAKKKSSETDEADQSDDMFENMPV